MNFDQARCNMVQQQIKPWNITDESVLDLFQQVRREDFMPDEYRLLALADTNIPLINSQVTMTPKMEARLLQALAIKPTDDILEVGTGCAYLTALLAKSGKHVVSVDIYADFSEPAKQKLERYNISNVTLECGNALHGWQPSNLYDVIAVTGSVDTLDTAIKWQLRINGRLFVIVGKPPVMEAKLITRSAENNWHDETLFETCLPPLEGITGTKPFKF